MECVSAFRENKQTIEEEENGFLFTYTILQTVNINRMDDALEYKHPDNFPTCAKFVDFATFTYYLAHAFMHKFFLWVPVVVNLGSHNQAGIQIFGVKNTDFTKSYKAQKM